FSDSEFDRLVFRESLEMLDDVVKTMEEAHRVTKPGGRVEIHTNHFAASNSYVDPRQKWHFSFYTFDYFLEDFLYPVYTHRKYRMIERHFIFHRKWGMGSLLARISPRRYEKYYAHRYPPYRLSFELEAVK
ncbi:MAG: methyltransferase domain-containing protein, partial [Candidatus Omnitrophica bacterium]|nr:methyltransferase domain-containing protein [Candidatus Omnitrophota bacterium]